MILASAVGTAVWVALGLALMVGIWRFGWAMLQALSAPPTPPPEAGELRKVNVRYRCDVCGVELKLTMAPDDDPPPPRHCLEDMVIVPPLYD
ncbi:MAG: hypothetical protein CL424_02795 [Acidimicrobiaceae bacterium]|nr:hypothetical protein [Acidimicrobiaceae bacterium]